MSFRPFALMLVPALLAGCAAVGPDYQRPATAMAGEWLEPASAEPVDPQWWASFGDPMLTSLVERALANNPGLAEASARVAEARALREAAQGGRLPQGGIAAAASQNRISENGQFPVARIPGFDPNFPIYDIGFDASWELDLWGGTSRAIESAAAQERAAAWARRDAMVALAAEVARTYVDYRAAQARLGVARDEAEASEQIARLTQLLGEAGEVDRIEAGHAASASEGAQVALRGAEANVASAEYRLAVLAGATPEAILPELKAATAPIPAPPAVIASGVRSELLERRPDIRKADAELAAMTAAIGVAKAQLYPSLTLTGGIGTQAQEPGDLADGGSLRYSIGPSFRWPIFSLGRIRAQVRAADARADGAAARYEAAVVGALGESENAANRYASASLAARAAAAGLAREEEAYRLASLRERSGEDSRLMREQARLRLAQARRLALDARTGQASAAIALYKALGGGWPLAEALHERNAPAVPEQG